MDVRVGDNVDVPGGMYGTVKFVGEVAGKKGKFAGVQLAAEFAARGKNSGDVEGKYYFRTTKPGAGIFLPVEKATRRGGGGPSTPAAAASSLANFNQGGRMMPVLPKPNFSQSIGPGARAASPALKPTTSRRPSLPRQGSPTRKVPALKPAASFSTPVSRPSLGPGSKSKVGMGSRYGQSPMGRTSTFGASVRGTPTTTPSRTPLGPEPLFDEDSELTPTATPVAAKSIDHTIKDEEISRLKVSLEERDRQSKEQANTLSDMEKSLAELHSLLPADYEPVDHRRETGNGYGSDEAVQMRSILREKNEKIQMLIAEFDAHRADFRSTIDTLEMASTETERVYEKRVEELLQEVRDLQDRGDDVENVAEQLKQLEEFVQELEEGLEDARRGEAEARGEVEFLRGEVERGRSELKREKTRATSAGTREEHSDDDGSPSGSSGSRARELDAKDDEIRGLKAIIHSLSGSEPSAASAVNGHPDNAAGDIDRRDGSQLHELEVLLAEKSSHAEELERELEQLRTSTTAGLASPHASPSSLSSVTHESRSNTDSAHRLSDRTVVPGGGNGSNRRQQQQQQQQTRTQSPPSPSGPATQLRPESVHEADTVSSTMTGSSGSASLWCEICETTGHDILTCTNMFVANGGGGGGGAEETGRQQQQQQETPPSSSIRSDANDNKLNTRRSPLPSSFPPPRTSSSKLTQQPFSSSSSSSPSPLPLPLAIPVSVSSQNTTATTPSHPNPHPHPQSQSQDHPPPSSSSSSSNNNNHPSNPIHQPLPSPPPNLAGMVAGKSSGVIDANKWCALCERDGHESVDCPFEDGF